MLYQQLLQVSHIAVYMHLLLEVRDNIWFGYLRLSFAEHYGHKWLFTDEWVHWTHQTGLAVNIHVNYKRVPQTHLCPYLKGLHGCLKYLNFYKPLFATTKKKEKCLHAASSTCSTAEAPTRTHRDAHVSGEEGCAWCPRFLLVLVFLGELSLEWGPVGCTTGLSTERESLGLCKDWFQPQLGLCLQILLFVQPSCTYTNEWHLHGTILQHQNWPTHSVPCH